MKSYNASRRAAALPRWKLVADMRKRGMLWREIADKLGIDIAMAHRLETKWQSYQLNQ